MPKKTNPIRIQKTTFVSCAAHWLCVPLYFLWRGIKKLHNALSWYTMEYPIWHFLTVANLSTHSSGAPKDARPISCWEINECMNAKDEGSDPATNTSSITSHLIWKPPPLLRVENRFYLTKLGKIRISEKWYVTNELVYNVPKKTKTLNNTKKKIKVSLIWSSSWHHRYNPG